MPRQKPQKAAKRLSAAEFVKSAPRNPLMVRCSVCLTPEVRDEAREVLKEIREQGRVGISRRMIYQHLCESYPDWEPPSFGAFERHLREHERAPKAKGK